MLYGKHAAEIALYRSIVDKTPLPSGSIYDHKLNNRELIDHFGQYRIAERANDRNVRNDYIRVISSSEFNSVLNDVFTVAIKEASDVQSSWEEITTSIEVPDFKLSSVLSVTTAGLLFTPEGGEIKSTPATEVGGLAKIDGFSRIFGITREVFYNSNLGLYQRLGKALYQKAKNIENKLFFNLLQANPVMQDGFAFFSAEHGNVGTAGVVSSDTIGELLALIAAQKDSDGDTMNLRGVTLLAGTSDLMRVESIFAGLTDAGIKRVYDSRISDGSYYMFTADPGINVLHLENSEGLPSFDTMTKQNTDNIEYRVRHNCGVALSDYRSIAVNYGGA